MLKEQMLKYILKKLRKPNNFKLPYLKAKICFMRENSTLTLLFLQSCSLYSILLFANVFMLQWCKQEELLTSKEIKKI